MWGSEQFGKSQCACYIRSFSTGECTGEVTVDQFLDCWLQLMNCQPYLAIFSPSATRWLISRKRKKSTSTEITDQTTTLTSAAVTVGRQPITEFLSVANSISVFKQLGYNIMRLCVVINYKLPIMSIMDYRKKYRYLFSAQRNNELSNYYGNRLISPDTVTSHISVSWYPSSSPRYRANVCFGVVPGGLLQLYPSLSQTIVENFKGQE